MSQTKTVEEMQASLKDTWEFSSEEKWHLNGRGDVWQVKCPFTCYNFDWLLGKVVTINGTKYKAIAVERFTKAGSIRKNEMIGLLVHSMDYAVSNRADPSVDSSAAPTIDLPKKT